MSTRVYIQSKSGDYNTKDHVYGTIENPSTDLISILAYYPIENPSTDLISILAYYRKRGGYYAMHRDTIVSVPFEEIAHISYTESE
jgi:hypothetical protein